MSPQEEPTEKRKKETGETIEERQTNNIRKCRNRLRYTEGETESDGQIYCKRKTCLKAG